MQRALKHFGLAVALACSMLGAAQAEPGDDTRPQLTLRYEFGGGQPQQFLANGVRLTPAAPTPLRAKEQSDSSGSSAAAVVLAIGVALALVVLVAGDTAEDITDGKDDGDGDAGDCIPGMPGC
jgi:hypothetical protein